MLARIMSWLNTRYPLQDNWRKHFTHYYVPHNLNFWYCFGVLALVVFAIQFISGVWLSFFYIPTAKQAFHSIETMMREVNFGWLLRYIHTTGASAFFIVIYAHILRSILYGSYKKPRELIWLSGLVLYMLLMLEAFCGYVLPWGQMSYWAVQVVSATLSAIPIVGDSLMTWLRGDYNVSTVTLHRCFTLHVVVLPLIFIFFIKRHLISLRHIGSSNPSGEETISKIPFHPYYTLKDLWIVLIFLTLFASAVFFIPNYFLEANNFLPADTLQTPSHITTPWYIAPYYAMLRAIPNKLGGVSITLLVMLLWFLLPWIDRCQRKSLMQRTTMIKISFIGLLISFGSLGYLGSRALTTQAPAQLFLALYIVCFILIFIFSRFEKGDSL